MPLTLSKATLTEGSRPSFEAGRKLGVVEMALVWKVLHEEPQCPSRVYSTRSPRVRSRLR
jgi:hypothetical protein